MSKVLLIDDDPLILEYLKRICAAKNHVALTAQTGLEGCHLAADPEIQLIITDLRLGGQLQKMDLVRELKRRRPELPMIVISGYPSDALLEECRAIGVTDFLTKPFEMSFAANIIDRLLQQPSGN